VVTCQLGSQVLKMKVPRSVPVESSGELMISLRPEKSLIYQDGKLLVN
jgi:hypothetical protein